MAPKFLLTLTVLLAVAVVASAEQCPAGQTAVDGRCVPNCNAANCDICDPHDLNHTDCATCSFGYILDAQKTCRPACTIANCVTCSSSGNNACQECAKGYLRTAAGECKRFGNSARTLASVAAASAILVASVIAIAA